MLLTLVFGSIALQAKADQTLYLVSSYSNDLHREMANEITRGLNQNTANTESIDQVSVNIEQIELSEFLTRIAANPESIQSHDFLISIGSMAAQKLSEKSLAAPILYSLLPYSRYHGLELVSDSQQQACRKASGLYLDQPVTRQLRLAQLLFPQHRKLGTILGPTSSQRFSSERESERALEKIRVLELHESRDLPWSVKQLSREVDAILAINDPLVLNPGSAKWLLYISYQLQKPLIAFTQSYVNAGASAAVYSTPNQYAQQALQDINPWLRGEKICLLAPHYSDFFSVAINPGVSQSLGAITISEEKALARLRDDHDRQ
jgi:ABC-type uncharacterized transport system substrate-binding protein